MVQCQDKYDSVNERIQEISRLMKLHIQGVWQNAHKFIRQLAYCQQSLPSTLPCAATMVTRGNTFWNSSYSCELFSIVNISCNCKVNQFFRYVFVVANLLVIC